MQAFTEQPCSRKRIQGIKTLHIKTFGSVILDGIYMDRLNMLADSVIIKGNTEIKATDQFEVNRLTQESGSLSAGNGTIRVRDLYEIKSGAVLNALDKLHVIFGDFENNGTVNADHLTIKLIHNISKLGKVKAKTLMFDLADAVDVDWLFQNADLRGFSILNVNGNNYSSISEFSSSRYSFESDEDSSDSFGSFPHASEPSHHTFGSFSDPFGSFSDPFGSFSDPFGSFSDPFFGFSPSHVLRGAPSSPFITGGGGSSFGSGHTRFPSAPSKPKPNESAPQWQDTFRLKGGQTITRAPGIISCGGISSGRSLSFSSGNLNINVSIDMTREQFVASLKKTGML
ncbi:MAG: hypothetical protein ABFQ95_07210 [Pseudomonadota bacterium]